MMGILPGLEKPVGRELLQSCDCVSVRGELWGVPLVGYGQPMDVGPWGGSTGQA